MPTALPLDDIEWQFKLDAAVSTSEDLQPPAGIMGHRRAQEALSFGLAMEAGGYNLFVMGEEGSRRRRTTQEMVTAAASHRPVPSDWCYVDNFEQQREPIAIELPAGTGRQFRDRMAQFVESLQDSLRAAFQGEEYRNLQTSVEDEFKEESEDTIQAIDAQAQKEGLALMRTPMGLAFAPVADGKVMSGEDFQKLPEAEREEIQERIKKYEATLRQAMRGVPMKAYAAREKIRQLNRETAMGAVDFLLGPVREDYAAHPSVSAYLDLLRADLVANVEPIIAALDEPRATGFNELLNGHPFYRRYLVHLLIDRTECDKAPVIFEDEPNLDRLIGTVEHRAEMGTLQTDFHLIRPGALHRANGGYLILDALKILSRPFVWDALKRALIAREIRIETLPQAAGYMSTISLEPKPIPLDVKIILVGERRVYYALSALDPEFDRLFKVAADFDDEIKVETPGTITAYAAVIADIARQNKLKPLTKAALETVLWKAARDAGNRQRLTTQVRKILDLLQEADHIAASAGRAQIDAGDIHAALDNQQDRLWRIPALMQDQILEETIDIDTDGSAIGQVNGLTVSQIGGLSFGRPARITARIALGKGEVVDIEREVELGGPIHSKGVLILSNFLRATFGGERPLSLHASLVFEQSYGGVDGDSASMAEACTLFSAIAQVPVRQDFAITGSMNQMGTAQAIGGVNEKIEGYFDICRGRGLTGRQGVIIPCANQKHLLLAPRVIEAVRAGQFAIYAVGHVTEAAELLTGLPTGERAAPGAPFPDGTLFAKIDERLKQLDAARRRAALRDGEDKLL